MGIPFPEPRHLPCPECGTAVERSKRDSHLCDPERVLEYVMFRLREEVEGLERGLAAYLESPHGRFELWCAERDRKKRL